MSVIEMFSTHLKIKDSNGSLIRYTYESDNQLEKNIRDLYHSDSNDNEDYWAWKFLVICQTDSSERLAPWHMSAYLQKFVVNPAYRVHRKLRNYQQYTQHQYEIRDVLDIGLLIACDSKKFFSKQFFRNFHQGRPLRNYVYITMERKIDEMIRQEMGQKKFSDWGLLKYSTRTYLRKALQQVYRPSQLEGYLSTFDCFKAVYAPQIQTGKRSLPPPTDQQLQEMTNLYNQQATLGKADIVQMKQWLRDCIQALRMYQTIPFVSLDAPIGGQENLVPLSETIPDPASGSYEERLMSQELTLQLRAILSEFLKHIDQKTDNYLLLRYGLDAKYRQLDPIFLVDYTNISRRCNQVEQSLLKLVAQWAQKELNIIPDSEMLAQMKAPLNDCLIEYYQNLIFHSVFQQAWQQLDQQRRQVLHLSYSYFWLKDEAEAAIARKLQLVDQSEVRAAMETGTQELVDAISKWIQERLTVSSDLLNPFADKITDLVRTLVTNCPAPEF